MLRVDTDGVSLWFGDTLRISLHRTLRVPEGSHTYPLPPSFGPFPISRLDRGSAEGAVLAVGVPMRQSEALWIGFDGAEACPHAVKIGLGAVDALTGGPWDGRLARTPQNYLVCPLQPWLDGVLTEDGSVRQFVAAPLGAGVSIEEQLSSAPPTGTVRLKVFPPLPECLVPSQAGGSESDAPAPALGGPPPAPTLALGAGGKIRQRLYLDPYGVDIWASEGAAEAEVHLLNADQYRELTGQEPPPTPIDAASYARLGLPWFEFYEDRPSLSAPPSLHGLRTVGDSLPGAPEALDVENLHVRPIIRGVPDGNAGREANAGEGDLAGTPETRRRNA